MCGETPWPSAETRAPPGPWFRVRRLTQRTHASSPMTFAVRTKVVPRQTNPLMHLHFCHTATTRGHCGVQRSDVLLPTINCTQALDSTYHTQYQASACPTGSPICSTQPSCSDHPARRRLQTYALHHCARATSTIGAHAHDDTASVAKNINNVRRKFGARRNCRAGVHRG